MSPAADPQAKVMAQAMTDPVFRKRLLADPARTLGGGGFVVSDDLSILWFEDTATLRHFVLPAPVDDSLLTDFDLDAVAGGRSGGCVLPSGCFSNTG